MKDKLKPKNCPCCGKEAYFDMTVEPHKHQFATFMPDVTGYTSFIFCSKCGLAISGDECETEQEAKENVLAKWNTRPEDNLKKKIKDRIVNHSVQKESRLKEIAELIWVLEQIEGKENDCRTNNS